MVLTMGRNLTPIMLALGPLLLLVAFAMFPLQDQIGQNAMDALVDEDRSFMVMLLVVGTFGVTLVFGGLNLLIKDMKKNTDGMNAQLLSYAKVLMIVALVCFFQGFGGYVAAINAFETEIDETHASHSSNLSKQIDFTERHLGDTATEEQVREVRNALLINTDWTQLPDVPDAIKNKYTVYRQSLRDLTKHENFPNLKQEDFPTKPS